MSLLGKVVAKSVGKSIVKKHGIDVVNKLEDMTRETRKKLEKKQKKNPNNFNGFTRKEVKRYKRLFIFLIILFAVVALLLIIDNNKKDKDESDNNKIIEKKEEKKIEPVVTPTIVPTTSSTPIITPSPKPAETPIIEDTKEEIVPQEKTKYKVIIHIEFKENVILNKYDVKLEIGDHIEILTHGNSKDIELSLEEGKHTLVFTSVDEYKLTKKMEINVTSNMKVGYDLSCHSIEIQVNNLYTNIIDSDGNILEMETLRNNFEYDISFCKSNPYQGYYSTTYLVFDFDSFKTMEFDLITSAKYGHKSISIHGRNTYSGDINEKVIIEITSNYKEEYVRDGDKLILYDKDGNIKKQYSLCDIDRTIEVLKENSSYFE